MAGYKTGKKSRNRIILACKELFYKKGYKKTTYKDICDLADSNPGLINYYFKTKRKIAEIIYGNIFVDIKAEVERYLNDVYGHYDLQIGTSLEHKIFSELVDMDENINRFFYEMCTEAIDYDIKIYKFFYKLHVEKYHLPLTEDQIRLIWVSNVSIGIGIAKKYIEGYLRITKEDLYEFRTRTMYQSMGIEEKRIDEIIQEVYKIFETTHIYLEDYFKVRLEPVASES